MKKKRYYISWKVPSSNKTMIFDTLRCVTGISGLQTAVTVSAGIAYSGAGSS